MEIVMEIQALTSPPQQAIPAMNLQAASMFQQFLGKDATLSDGAMFIINLEHFMNAVKSVCDNIAEKGLNQLKQEAEREAQGS